MDAALAIKPSPYQRIRRSLSAQLLGLTLLFVLIAEAVVLIQSVSKQRVDWLSTRIEAAYLVGLALEGSDDEMIDPMLARQLFATANILGVTITRDGARIPVYSPEIDPAARRPMHYINLTSSTAPKMVSDAWATMFSKGDDLVRVVGRPTYGDGEEVDILVSQQALRRDLLIYARNILLLSLVISTLTGGLVYWTLNAMIVRPVRRLTVNMATFNANPEDAGNIVPPTGRKDEIGETEEALRSLELRIHDLLSQRRRLAALGAGISKISHDLRNILASAQLMSDRLAKSDDPRVRKLSPRLIQALDRAISLSRDTLSYGRMEPASLSKTRFDLHELVEEAFADTAVMHVAFVNDTPVETKIYADRNQLYRALFNLVRNAVEAMTPAEDASPSANTSVVSVRARASAASIEIDVADTGPGVPDKAQAQLFEPFQGSNKPGGSGLGVAIAYEILRAHGGALALTKSDASGATFTLTVPFA
ncbi:MAG: HAMP domain-containing sensor histidine kinase [Amphiplicatus sp.]